MNHPTDNTAELLTQTNALHHDVEQIAQDARGLLAATAEVAGAKVTEARRRLAEALDRSKGLYAAARSRALEGSHAADDMVRTHLYPTIALGTGAGFLVGFLLANRRPHHFS